MGKWMVYAVLLKISVSGFAEDVFLTETQPDNLFCLDGFMMFTDVLSL